MLQLIQKQSLNTLLHRLPISFSRFKSTVLMCSAKEAEISKVVQPKLNSKIPVENEIMIYEYENTKYYKKLRVFSLIQFVAWGAFGVSCLHLLYNRTPQMEKDNALTTDQEISMARNFIIASMLFGTVLFGTIWFFIARSVRSIVICKKTKDVVFQTYSPIGIYNTVTVPITDISGVIGRHKEKRYIPLKVKGYWFYFLLDIDGEMKNTYLFDKVINVKRDFK